MSLHVDTDFLIYALETAGQERRRLLEVAESDHALCISSVAWYEFSRGPRTRGMTVSRPLLRSRPRSGWRAVYCALLRRKLKFASCPARVTAFAWQLMHVPS